ncbi:ATP-dependent helicase HepA [Oceanospirillum sp. MED92]|uniref:ATP-dependent helicase HepA n=1 Tax=Neptuniibacter caesariensis TaxID=207954 RepID=A0A7U8GR20_NEPCE|nr:ATP-dependent helicase HepA [Oceanospirillum sp. MED92] [Neptuniibacter caesariensis]
MDLRILRNRLDGLKQLSHVIQHIIVREEHLADLIIGMSNIKAMREVSFTHLTHTGIQAADIIH